MGTISDKLTYLNTTKLQLKDMINYGLDDDNKITSSTTFRNYVASIFKAFLESLNNPSTLFNNLPKITGTGSNITLNDTANAPMRIMLNATDITQDGTPTPDSPQDIHTISGDNKLVVRSKNLFNPTIQVGTYNDAVYTVNNDIITQSASDNSAWYITADRVFYLNAGTYTIKIYGTFDTLQLRNITDNIDIVKAKVSSKTFTLDSTKALAFKTYGNGVTYPVSYYIQLEEGNTATSYEPYVLQTAEVNLVNPNNLIGLTTERCPVDLKAGDKLTIGNLTSTQITFNCYTNRGDTTRNDYWNIQTSQKVRTITLGYDTKEIAWTTTPDNIIWINKGETLLPYEPYYNIEYCKMPNTNYKDQFIRTSGKQLFKPNFTTTTQSGITFTASDNYSVMVNGTASETVGFTIALLNIEVGKTYTIGVNTRSKNGVNLLTQKVKDGTYIDVLKSFGYNENSFTFTADSTFNQIRFRPTITSGTNVLNEVYYITLCEGTTALPYEPYGTDEWYIKKNIGKHTFTSCLNVGTNGSGEVAYNVGLGVIDDLLIGNYVFGYGNLFKSGTNKLTDCFRLGANNNQAYIYTNDTNFSTKTSADTFLTNNPFIVYYPTQTPTYTKITGALAEQLENIYQLLKSYKGVTNISQVNNDLPFDLDVQALEDLE